VSLVPPPPPQAVNSTMAVQGTAARTSFNFLVVVVITLVPMRDEFCRA